MDLMRITDTLHFKENVTFKPPNKRANGHSERTIQLFDSTCDGVRLCMWNFTISGVYKVIINM